MAAEVGRGQAGAGQEQLDGEGEAGERERDRGRGRGRGKGRDGRDVVGRAEEVGGVRGEDDAGEEGDD